MSTASAEVRSAVDLGRVSVSTASGDEVLASAREVTATTPSGDIRIGDVAADPRSSPRRVMSRPARWGEPRR